MSKQEQLINAAVGDDDDDDHEEETEGLTRRGRGGGNTGAGQDAKIESARKFLWDEDDDDGMQDVSATSHRGGYSDDPSGQRKSDFMGSMDFNRGMETMEFNLHDAAPADGDEYLGGGKRSHTMNPIVAAFSGCYHVILGTFAFVGEKVCSPGCRKVLIVLVAMVLIGVGIVKIGSKVSMPSAGSLRGDPGKGSHNAERYDAIRQTILDSTSIPADELDTKKTPHHNALYWLADIDKSEIEPNHFGLISRYQLAVLYFATEGHGSKDGTPYAQYLDWMSGEGICVWEGVTCAPEPSDSEHHGSVQSLELKNSITNGGRIPSYFHGFEDLEKIDLRGNGLDGTIPSHLFDNIGLKEVLLEKNNLHGDLPGSYHQPCRLDHLNFAESEFLFYYEYVVDFVAEGKFMRKSCFVWQI